MAKGSPDSSVDHFWNEDVRVCTVQSIATVYCHHSFIVNVWSLILHLTLASFRKVDLHHLLHHLKGVLTLIYPEALKVEGSIYGWNRAKVINSSFA